NHLDAETVTWLEHQLRDFPGTVIISTHDRYFLDNVTKWILELDNGKGIPFEGNYSSWLGQKLEILIKQEKKESTRRKSLERELKWIRMSSTDRNAQNQNRIRSFEQLLVQEQAKDDEDQSVIQIAPAAELGDQVIEFEKITKGYGEFPLIKDLSFSVPKGAIVGIIGPNGAGKTTLFRMITGQETPDAGNVKIGKTVQLAYVDQHRDALHGDNTVYDEITEGKSEIPFGNLTIPARTYVGRFNFKGSDQQKKVGVLSGGERNRVHLAKLLKSGKNVLLLDEPTNDLDVGTLRLLEDAINGFAGCVLVVSHDRFFLNRICTHLLVFEGDASVRWFTGNYEEYEARRREELGDSRVENRRAKYRKLPRIA
ncbi:MAG: ATP-binding cassette domain-containing protein, partial [Candidatus Sumerlaeia bacterium]|nr:ATP-binding cassette domain-containing protein [Candidatus Sumerlaeia bacterium]